MMGPVLRWETRLVEEVVGLDLERREEGGDPRPALDYRRGADELYRIDPARREREFAALHWRLFQELGFEARAAAVVDRYRPALGAMEQLALLGASRPGEEGADLGAPAPDRARPGALRVRAARFLAPVELIPFLHHELLHLADLVDPRFAHDPGSLLAIAPHRRRLVQQRYRAAWAASADGRLSRRGLASVADRAEHLRRLDAHFPALSAGERQRLLDVLWHDDRPTHAGLLEVAAPGAADSPQPGAPCPLCGFPTHRWAEVSDERVREAIRLDAPGWQAGEGCCERCVEVYELHCPARA